MKTPVIFVGHGSPMNILENNKWTKKWRELGNILKDVNGIVMISAHWYTRGSLITKEEYPKTIHDMYGFPEELYKVQYPAKNNQDFRNTVFSQVSNLTELNDGWGYDHGNYSVLYHMFPKADKPLLQISINGEESLSYHYELGESLRDLRANNYLIIASGNIVHNLRLLEFKDTYPWAIEFDDLIEDLVKDEDDSTILSLEGDKIYNLSVPTPDHFLPFIVALGSRNKGESLKVFNKDYLGTSLSMTSYIWGLEEYLRDKNN